MDWRTSGTIECPYARNSSQSIAAGFVTKRTLPREVVKPRVVDWLPSQRNSRVVEDHRILVSCILILSLEASVYRFELTACMGNRIH